MSELTVNVMSYHGHASGWSVHLSRIENTWQWSAYGPRGGTQGNASSEAEARDKALHQHEALSQPRLITL